nr:hypothetical protein [uncultured Albidiferax sp.]
MKAMAQPLPVDATVIAPETTWALSLPKTDPIKFHGVVNLDNAGNQSGSMLYPAVGLVGLIAAIATHGVIMDTVKSAEKIKLQEQADMVLAPYAVILRNIQHAELSQKGLGNLAAIIHTTETTSSDWQIESAPIYSMTQDGRAIILDNIFTIRKTGTHPESARQAVVRVVSAPKDAEDITAYWTSEQGFHLKDESIQLFAQSLELGIRPIQQSNAEPRVQKTVRYMEGRTERMERGEVLRKQCNRLVIKTLRGTLMSVPSVTTGENDKPSAECS